MLFQDLKLDKAILTIQNYDSSNMVQGEKKEAIQNKLGPRVAVMCHHMLFKTLLAKSKEKKRNSEPPFQNNIKINSTKLKTSVLQVKSMSNTSATNPLKSATN